MSTFIPETPDTILGDPIRIGSTLQGGVLKIGTFLIGERIGPLVAVAPGALALTSATPDTLP